MNRAPMRYASTPSVHTWSPITSRGKASVSGGRRLSDVHGLRARVVTRTDRVTPTANLPLLTNQTT